MIATNLTELIRSEELCGLLRLCGTEDSELTNGSDYDFFAALCRSLPLLCGHPLPVALRSLLRMRFGISLPLTLQNAPEIWHTVAEMLLEKPIPIGGELVLLPAVAPLALPPLERRGSFAALQADDLTDTGAASWSEWETELRAACDSAARDGICHVKLTLTDEDICQRSSLFRVERALQATSRSREDRACLKAQLLRFLCMECARRDLILMPEVDAASGGFADCLERMERNVGLPKLLVLLSSKDAFEAFLTFAKRAHRSSVRLAIDRSRYAARETLERAVAEIAGRYPLGRLAVIDGEDLCEFV